MDIFSYRFTFPHWFNSTFLGLKIGIWLILFTSAAFLIPLIIFVAYRDTLPAKLQNALLILGIILMSSGVLAFLLFLVINQIRITRNIKIKNEVNRISTEILRLILEYSESKSGKMICWKCFKEIKKGLTTCPECGIKL